MSISRTQMTYSTENRASTFIPLRRDMDTLCELWEVDSARVRECASWGVARSALGVVECEKWEVVKKEDFR